MCSYIVYEGESVMEEDTPTLLSFDVIDLSRNISLDLREMIQKEGVVLYEEV